MRNNSLSDLSLKYIWHPFTQMQSAKPPIGIKSGKGALLFDEYGNEYIDAISSWWTCLHGHSNDYIAKAIYEQVQELEHVIFAGFTHEPAVKLASNLLSKLPNNISKVFYSDNGSTAVEVALKMAFQYWFNVGQKRTTVIALDGAYHGDTFGSMSVSARSPFSEPFSPFLFDVQYLPNPSNTPFNDVLNSLQKIVEESKNNIACFIYEPLVQGAGGMLMYDEKLLSALLQICKTNNIICIADEVMTGFYRTAKFFASDYIDIKPDIFALSKGLTGGTMALGVTACSENIYNAFLSHDKMKTFFHGHSFTANPLACAVSNASFELLNSETTINAVNFIESKHAEFRSEIEKISKVENVRQKGTILAMDIASDENTSYFNNQRDSIYNYFIQRGILLRPLGNTIYILPPYCITNEQLEKVYSAIIGLLEEK